MDLDREDDEEPDSSRNKRNGLGEPLLYVTSNNSFASLRTKESQALLTTSDLAYLAQISPKTKVASTGTRSIRRTREKPSPAVFSANVIAT